MLQGSSAAEIVVAVARHLLVQASGSSPTRRIPPLGEYFIRYGGGKKISPAVSLHGLQQAMAAAGLHVGGAQLALLEERYNINSRGGVLGPGKGPPLSEFTQQFFDWRLFVRDVQFAAEKLMGRPSNIEEEEEEEEEEVVVAEEDQEESKPPAAAGSAGGIASHGERGFDGGQDKTFNQSHARTKSEFAAERLADSAVMSRFRCYIEDRSENIKQIFDSIDRNRDRKIDKGELLRVLHKAGASKVDEDTAARLIKYYDQDGDGALTLREFVRMRQDLSNAFA